MKQIERKSSGNVRLTFLTVCLFYDWIYVYSIFFRVYYEFGSFFRGPWIDKSLQHQLNHLFQWSTSFLFIVTVVTGIIINSTNYYICCYRFNYFCLCLCVCVWLFSLNAFHLVNVTHMLILRNFPFPFHIVHLVVFLRTLLHVCMCFYILKIHYQQWNSE